jgi:hypothetical protein
MANHPISEGVAYLIFAGITDAARHAASAPIAVSGKGDHSERSWG